MKTFDAKKGGAVIYGLAAIIQSNKDYLSEIDGATGDGDHGVNMNKGFTMFGERFAGTYSGIGFAELADELGNILISEIGGSMGPLYGTFFMDMAESVRGKDRIGAEDYLAMLKAGLSGIMSIVDTQLGDKTLLDALIPAIDAFEAALGRGCDFGEALAAHKEAAQAGREATKGMAAKVGRASRLGERSRGFYDAGATSCALILAGMADAILPLLE